MDFSSDFLASITEFEGSTDWMYLDSAGNVTAGVGHLIASPNLAAALPFQGGNPSHDWGAVKKSDRGKLADYYKQYSTCRLTPGGVQDLLQSDLESAVQQLSAGLPGFPSLPLCVREALIDMAFNLGAAKLLGTYDALLKCVKSGDWNGAAGQCHRNGVAASRNEWCAEMFRTALPG